VVSPARRRVAEGAAPAPKAREVGTRNVVESSQPSGTFLRRRRRARSVAALSKRGKKRKQVRTLGAKLGGDKKEEHEAAMVVAAVDVSVVGVGGHPQAGSPLGGNIMPEGGSVYQGRPSSKRTA